MTRRSSLFPILLLTTLLLLVGCKPTVPRRYLQPDDMEDLLYDYHLAMATAATEYQRSIDIRQLQDEYRRKVLAKHGITQAQFDESMVYYFRHADRLNDIYKRLGQRFADDGAALGVNIARKGTDLPATGDTANVWKGDNTCTLLPYKPHNVYTFSIKADTTYHPGDQLALNFDVAFIYQDGPRDATAYFIVRFANDSTATQMRRINTTSHYSLTVTDQFKAGIKEVKGYFIMPQSLADLGSSSYRVISLYDIHLVRTHPGSKPPANEADGNGAATNLSSPAESPVLQQAEEGAGEQSVVPVGNQNIDRSQPHRSQGGNHWGEGIRRPANKNHDNSGANDGMLPVNDRHTRTPVHTRKPHTNSAPKTTPAENNPQNHSLTQ